jgi:hypothetical protein
MSKGTTIFQEKKQTEHKSATPNTRVITVSRDDYQETIKNAYQEGLNDAKKENGIQNTQKNVEDNKRNEGKEEAIKTHQKEEEENKQRFKAIVERQDIELLRVETVFPFTFFPDTLIIDTTKISISKKQLFATEYISTIPLKDLSDVNVQTVLFLGTLYLKYMPQASSPGMNNPVEIKLPNLKREDAIKAKNILKGVLVAKAEEIDIAKLAPDEIKEVLHKFGETEGVI